MTELTRPVPVLELSAGALVDLEGDSIADPAPAEGDRHGDSPWSFQYGRVESVRFDRSRAEPNGRRSRTAVAVFSTEDGVTYEYAFPLDHQLPVYDPDLELADIARAIGDVCDAIAERGGDVPPTATQHKAGRYLLSHKISQTIGLTRTFHAEGSEGEHYLMAVTYESGDDGAAIVDAECSCTGARHGHACYHLIALLAREAQDGRVLKV
jgi:hypothetical protein